MAAIIVIATVLIILLGITVLKRMKQASDGNTNPGKYTTVTINSKEVPVQLQYYSGHPDIKTRMNVYLMLNNGNIEICKHPVLKNNTTALPMVATIPVAAIKNITVKDDSTTNYETTTGRMIRFGDLGLALKTKVLNEAADLLISWKDGKETYETCFTKKGEGAVAGITDVKEMLEKWRSLY